MAGSAVEIVSQTAREPDAHRHVVTGVGLCYDRLNQGDFPGFPSLLPRYYNIREQEYSAPLPPSDTGHATGKLA